MVLPSIPPGPAPLFGSPEFAPIFGNVNQQITINGANFNVPGLDVKFGVTSAVVISANAAGAQVRVPAIVAGAYKITVTTNNGNAISTGNFIIL